MRRLAPLLLALALVSAAALAPGSAQAGPRLELSPALRAFIDLAMVESTSPQIAWHAGPRAPTPPSILGGPTLADPSKDPGNVALGAFQYGLALILGLGVQGNSYQDRSVGELPGLLSNADVRGGYPVWSGKRPPAP